MTKYLITAFSAACLIGCSSGEESGQSTQIGSGTDNESLTNSNTDNLSTSADDSSSGLDDKQTNGGIVSTDTNDTGTLEVCEAHDIDITVVPGRMMILFDMSTSMLSTVRRQSSIRRSLPSPTFSNPFPARESRLVSISFPTAVTIRAAVHDAASPTPYWWTAR